MAQMYESIHTEVVANMSHEISITVPASSLELAFALSRQVLCEQPDLEEWSASPVLSSFRHIQSDSNWSSEIELHRTSSAIELVIHSGNRKRLLSCLEACFRAHHLDYRLDEA